jgi:glycosyltransferase involved in cell wall biosynthesis
MSEIYDVSLVGNCQDKNRLRRRGINVDVLYVPIVRDISLLRDIKALFALFALFRTHKFDIVHSVSPKAGLLAMLAAWLARTRIRIHMFTGQVWAARTGLTKVVLKFIDKLLAACATNILVDSHSQLDFLLRQNVVKATKASVLANGSIKGVDTERFRPRQDLRDAIRTKLSIPQGATVFVFVGRLKRDKGVVDLAMAFSQVCMACAETYLMVVGADEENLRPEIERCCANCIDKVRIVDQNSTPENYIVSADVLCLPSYREGFGTVVIEAAACEVPALASRIYGLTDAIRENDTGLFHVAGNVLDLASGMTRMVQDPAMRIEMGKRARIRAVADFSSDRVTLALLRYYQQELSRC